MDFRDWLYQEEVGLDKVAKIKQGYALKGRLSVSPGTFGVEFEFVATPTKSVVDIDTMRQELRDSDSLRQQFERDHPHATDGDLDKFIQGIIDNQQWQWYGVRPRNNAEREDDKAVDSKIAHYVDVLTKMGLAAERGEGDTSKWTLSEDSLGIVEIRSPILQAKDFDAVRQVGEMIRKEKVTGETSAHVHIGMPPDTDPFDLLAMTTLVDEKSIKKDEGRERNFDRFANLNRQVHKDLYDWLKPQEYSASQMMEKIGKLSRYIGTNVTAWFSTRTVEFRYLSSRMNPDKLIKWIDYFMELPNIARSRNQIRIQTREGAMVATRRHNGNVLIEKTDRRVATPALPASHLRSSVREPLYDVPNQRWLDRLGSLLLKRHPTVSLRSLLGEILPYASFKGQDDLRAELTAAMPDWQTRPVLLEAIWPRLPISLRREIVNLAIKAHMLPAAPSEKPVYKR